MASPGALAQGWAPDRAVRFVVPFPPGGATDVWARMTAEGMQAQLGQPILIDNRGGARGMLGAEAVMRAPRMAIRCSSPSPRL